MASKRPNSRKPSRAASPPSRGPGPRAAAGLGKSGLGKSGPGKSGKARPAAGKAPRVRPPVKTARARPARGKPGSDQPPKAARGTARRAPKPARALKVTPLDALPLESDGRVRINRFLASSGVSSRRAADELVAEGRVTVNGEVVAEVGTRVDPVQDEVRVDDRRVQPERHTYVLFNKPKGVVCTNAPGEQRRRVVDFLPDVRGRLYTVGRLDAESEGLILLTNDGDFAQRVAHPSYGLAKTYAVLVRGRIDDDTASKARGGVWLAEGRTIGARVVVERRGRDRSYLKVSIREGRNREVRRVFARLGFPVLSLKRVRIGQLNLHGLGAGRYRFLQPPEVEALLELTRGGGDEPPAERAATRSRPPRGAGARPGKARAENAGAPKARPDRPRGRGR